MLLLAMVSLSFVVLSTPAVAQDVMIEVTTLKAKGRGRSDPELRRLRSDLRRLAGYRAFKLVDEQRRTCRWQDPQEFRLPGGRRLYLRPKRLADERVVMQVRMLHGTRELVDTNVRMRDQGTLFFGMHRGDGLDDGALLIMLKTGLPVRHAVSEVP